MASPLTVSEDLLYSIQAKKPKPLSLHKGKYLASVSSSAWDKEGILGHSLMMDSFLQWELMRKEF